MDADADTDTDTDTDTTPIRTPIWTLMPTQTPMQTAASRPKWQTAVAFNTHAMTCQIDFGESVDVYVVVYEGGVTDGGDLSRLDVHGYGEGNEPRR